MGSGVRVTYPAPYFSVTVDSLTDLRSAPEVIELAQQGSRSTTGKSRGRQTALSAPFYYVDRLKSQLRSQPVETAELKRTYCRSRNRLTVTDAEARCQPGNTLRVN